MQLFLLVLGYYTVVNVLVLIKLSFTTLAILLPQDMGHLVMNTYNRQGRIQLLSKVGVHIRHTITKGVGGILPGKKKHFLVKI